MVLEPLPPHYSPASMGQIMGGVLSALICSSVPFSAQLLGQVSRSGVVPSDPEAGSIFLEDIVDLYLPPDPRDVTVGNERVVFTSGFGLRRQQVAAHQVAHAADFFLRSPGQVDGGPAPPAT